MCDFLSKEKRAVKPIVNIFWTFYDGNTDIINFFE